MAAVTHPPRPPQFPALPEFEVVSRSSSLFRNDRSRRGRIPGGRSEAPSGPGAAGTAGRAPAAHCRAVNQLLDPPPARGPMGTCQRPSFPPVSSGLRVTPTAALRLDRNSLSGSLLALLVGLLPGH